MERFKKENLLLVRNTRYHLYDSIDMDKALSLRNIRSAELVFVI